MPEAIFTNARVILADEVIDGTVVFDGATVTDLSEGRSSLPAAVDLEGDYLTPGMVELHTDNMERHVTPRPNSHWPVAAAVVNHDREIAAAGITTVLNALSVGQIDPQGVRVEKLVEMCEATGTCKAQGLLKADHYLHLRCEVSFDGLADMVEPLVDMPLVKLMSLMDHTPGQRQFADLEQYAIYYQGKYKLSDVELDTFMKEKREQHRLHSMGNRRRVVEFAHDRQIQLASHDDATIEHVDEAVEDGVVVAEFPTTMDAARASHENGLAVLMGGPNVVRGRSHSGNESARTMAEAGYLDIVSSDYVPSSLLFAALKLEETVEAVDLPRAMAMVAGTPARQIGLDDRGVIALGKRSDFVRFRRTGAGPVIREVWREGERVA